MRTNSFSESARRLEKSQAMSVTVTSDEQGNTLSTERSGLGRMGSAKMRSYLAGTGLDPPSDRSMSPEGIVTGVGRHYSSSAPVMEPPPTPKSPDQVTTIPEVRQVN